ncbi:hypothetical protein ANCCEY_09562 [Ancylostoma ceylanicum]|uniref:SXP/RAL-2 family protein Ani s 5-like cation-binding domain-containing protein n=1 Tax=Ancylostoma ceylanicum TaxID=53326 RepID=A0A0D6LH98_9BILA|nr:hypothetical protein ANCCEY_09562 [Ancylostoma ceylanicum]
MPVKARSEFVALAKRQTLAWKEKERLMMEWAEKYDVKRKLEKFIDDMWSKRNAKEKAFFELIRKLPALGEEYMDILNGIETPREEKVANMERFIEDHPKYELYTVTVTHVE